MSAFGIIELHDEITRSNGYYCSICFRSALERRLVEPVFFNQFYHHRYFKKKLKICYICEAKAASALRFQKAVNLAVSVGVLYNDITETGHWQTVVKYLMDVQANNTPTVLAGSIVQRALAMDKALRATSRYELLATDTLVVSSVKEKPPPPPPPPPQPVSDTVVIVDDDEPAPAPPHVRVVNADTNEIVLHPVMKGSDGKLYVPSLKLQVLENGLFQGVTDVQIQNCTTSPAVMNPQVLMNVNNSHALQNANAYTNNLQNQTFVHTTHTQICSKTKQNHNSHKKTTDKNEYYNFLLTQTHQRSVGQQNGVNNVDVTKTNDMNIVLNTDAANANNKKRKLAEDPLRIDLPGSAKHDLREVQHAEQNIQEIKYEVGSDHVHSISNGMTESKAPVPRTDQTVDWEDKIPMDVISFMDATDPNPEERIMQPPTPAPLAPSHTSHTSHTKHTSHTAHALGFISDVRSVPDGANDQIECIDLC